MMADMCIVCEAFLQSCLENFLCDECRKPAETCLEKESAIDEGVEDTPLLPSFAQQLKIMKFQNAKNKTSRMKRKLWRQRGRVVRASDLKSVGRGFKSRSDH